MKRLVDIDTLTESVTLTAGETSSCFGLQWAEFYLLLGLLARTSDEPGLPLTRQILCSVGKWRDKTPLSAGKEVTRHIARLKREGLTGILGYALRTEGWWLEPVVEVVFRPSQEVAERWLARRQGLAFAHLAVPWLQQVVASLVALHQGRFGEARETLELARRETGDVDLLALLDYLAARVALRAGAEIETTPGLDKSGSMLAAALVPRFRALEMLSLGYETPALDYDALRRRISSLQSTPDLEALGLSYNTLGVLARRAGNADEAEEGAAGGR